ncbi:MAG: PAS domain S-box protein [Nitrosomonas sp.]|nr:PAS domain S-box protein [Nitrosomonas sp.]
MLVHSHLFLSDFDSPQSLKARMSILSKTAEIGEWFMHFAADTTAWSEYLYEFYELDRNFACSAILECTDLYAHAEKEKMRALIESVIETKTERSAEFMIVMPDGRIKWHDTTLHPVLGPDGVTIGLYGIVQNITAKKEQTREQRLYQRIFDQLPAGLFVMDPKGTCVYINQAGRTLKKHTITVPAGVAGHEHGDSANTASEADVTESEKCARLQQCMTDKRPIVFEEKLTDTKGRERIFSTRLLPILDETGNMDYFIEYGLDITTKKQYALERQRMAYVAEKTNGLVMITDPDRKIIWVNHSFEKILGYHANEVIGRNPASFLQGPETSSETIREISRSLKNTGSFSGEILNYTKRGEKIWLYLNITAVYDDTGKLINYVAVENDITLIKLAEQRLQQTVEKERELNRFKTQFVNLASHQFRTPLAAIRSSIDLLDLKLESLGNSPAFVEIFNRHKHIITEEIIRMTELMENILDIGRMDEGKIELSKKALPFKQFMDTFVQTNAETGGQHRKLKYRFDAPDGIINLDEILMRNVLRNIVSNAFKYSEGKPAPEMTVYYTDNRYFIRIKDYGIGIPEKDQPFLFQSFFRASNTGNLPGSGLGLMIAKKLILLHGGDIRCESKAGDGCTVTIQCA